jgi:ketosteroid isomerase-like protein
MGLDTESGTVETGKRADLSVLDGNPFEDIHNTRKLKLRRDVQTIKRKERTSRMRSIRTIFGLALSMIVLPGRERDESLAENSGTRGKVRSRNSIAICIVCLLITPVAIFRAVGQVRPAAGPTAENALAADEELARAIRNNDAEAILRMLDDSWAVISGFGGVGEGRSVFPDGIKSGGLRRKTFEISEPRVRLYGNTALVTTKVKTAGMFQGKLFDVTERQTDVLVWKDGGWKCVLTHETKIQNN